MPITYNSEHGEVVDEVVHVADRLKRQAEQEQAQDPLSRPHAQACKQD